MDHRIICESAFGRCYFFFFFCLNFNACYLHIHLCFLIFIFFSIIWFANMQPLLRLICVCVPTVRMKPFNPSNPPIATTTTAQKNWKKNLYITINNILLNLVRISAILLFHLRFCNIALWSYDRNYIVSISIPTLVRLLALAHTHTHTKKDSSPHEPMQLYQDLMGHIKDEQPFSI